jgi:CRISPR-associated protein Csm4
MKIVKIIPKTNFHTYLHSDTLWGNLVYAYKLLYGETALENLLENYLKGDIPFVVSSVFPYEIIKNGTEEILYYFPKPLLGGETIKAESPEDMTIIKEFKSIRFVEQRIFEEYLNGNLDDKSLFDRFKLFMIEENKKKEEKNENVIKENKFRYLKNITSIYNLHNSIDRMSGSTLRAESRGQLYWEDEYAFGNEMGLFFLAEISELDKFEALLRLLSHIGIGGNRSIGKGSFEFEIKEHEFNLPSECNAYVSLSLYHPSKDELENLASKNANLFYDISTRIGFVGKDFNNIAQEKNPVNCFTEGSTFFVKEKLKGCLVKTAKINQQKDVYSNYLFFGVKCNLR